MDYSKWPYLTREVKHEAVDYVPQNDILEEIQYQKNSSQGGVVNGGRRRKEPRGNDEGDNNEEERDNKEIQTSQNKHRLVWKPELHDKFVSAVNQLGIDKAVPKKIVQIMGVEGITRSHVSSHLQKYRMHLKKNASPYQKMSKAMGVNHSVDTVNSREGRLSSHSSISISSTDPNQNQNGQNLGNIITPRIMHSPCCQGMQGLCQLQSQAVNYHRVRPTEGATELSTQYQFSQTSIPLMDADAFSMQGMHGCSTTGFVDNYSGLFDCVYPQPPLISFGNDRVLAPPADSQIGMQVGFDMMNNMDISSMPLDQILDQFNRHVNNVSGPLGLSMHNNFVISDNFDGQTHQSTLQAEILESEAELNQLDNSFIPELDSTPHDDIFSNEERDLVLGCLDITDNSPASPDDDEFNLDFSSSPNSWL